MATTTKKIAALKISFDTLVDCDYNSHTMTIKSGDKAAWNKMCAVDKAHKNNVKLACMHALKDGKDIVWGNTFVTIVWAK